MTPYESIIIAKSSVMLTMAALCIYEILHIATIIYSMKKADIIKYEATMLNILVAQAIIFTTIAIRSIVLAFIPAHPLWATVFNTVPPLLTIYLFRVSFRLIWVTRICSEHCVGRSSCVLTGKGKCSTTK